MTQRPESDRPYNEQDFPAENEWLEEDHKNPAKAEQKRRRQIPLHDEPIGGG